MSLTENLNKIVEETNPLEKGDVIISLFKIINLFIFSYCNIIKKNIFNYYNT
tara:strand:- start:235 stop:390 length:156 start_codon:yes stop_codon:yes gene_type:complete